jgi:hypothetical protein
MALNTNLILIISSVILILIGIGLLVFYFIKYAEKNEKTNSNTIFIVIGIIMILIGIILLVFGLIRSKASKRNMLMQEEGLEVLKPRSESTEDLLGSLETMSAEQMIAEVNRMYGSDPVYRQAYLSNIDPSQYEKARRQVYYGY